MPSPSLSPFAAVTLGPQKTRARDIHSRTTDDGCEPRNSHDNFNSLAKFSNEPLSGPSPITTTRAVERSFWTSAIARSRYSHPFFSTNRPTNTTKLGSFSNVDG